MIEDSALDTKSIRMLVLDEADEMLSLGFRDQIEEIFRMLPTRTLQVVLVCDLRDAMVVIIHFYLSYVYF